MNSRRRYERLAVTTVWAALALGCNSGSAPSVGPADGGANLSPEGMLAIDPAQPRIEVTPPGLLLTSGGQRRRLEASLFDPKGAAGGASVTWTSSNPTVVKVDDSGTVEAVGPIGSASIWAEAGGVRSPTVVVLVARPAPGTVLLRDDQVISGPTVVDRAARPGLHNPFEVVLTGMAPPAPGTLLLNTELQPVAGRVVEAQAEGLHTRVRLVAAPPRAYFEQLRVRESLDLTGHPVVIGPEIARSHDVRRVGETLTFTPRTSALPSIRSEDASVGFRLGPFQCKGMVGASGNLPVRLTADPVFSITLSHTIDVEYDSEHGLSKLMLSGEPKIEVSQVLGIESAAEVSLECRVELGKRRLRVPLPLGALLGAELEYGAGFKLEGKLTLVSAKLGGKFKAETKFKAGLSCQPGQQRCPLVGELEPPKLDWEKVVDLPSLGDVRFEPSLQIFGYAAMDAGNPFLDELQLTAIELTSGPKLSGMLTGEIPRIEDPSDSGRSRYTLAFEARAAPGLDVAEFLQDVGLEAVTPLELKSEVIVGRSPEGTVTADRPIYLPGETVRVDIQLKPGSVRFPTGALYNVGRVALVRRSGPFSTETLIEQRADEGQTDFRLRFESPGLLRASELFGFVTSVLPWSTMELGSTISLVPLEVAGGTFQTADRPPGTAVLVKLRQPDGSAPAANVQVQNLRPAGMVGRGPAPHRDVSGRMAPLLLSPRQPAPSW